AHLVLDVYGRDIPLHDRAIGSAQRLGACFYPAVVSILLPPAKSVHEGATGRKTVRRPAKHSREVVGVSRVDGQGVEIFNMQWRRTDLIHVALTGIGHHAGGIEAQDIDRYGV